MLKIQSLRAKNTIVFIFCLLGLSLPFLFMNCSLDEGDFNRSSGITPEEVYTDPVPLIPGPDNRDKDKVVYPDGADIGEWKRTSQISMLDINIKSGKVSITHTKAGQWNPTKTVGSQSVEDPVEGNAWIFVPIRGKSYAAPYDWMGKADPHHMLDVGDLDGFYQQLPQRAGISALRNWVPVPGDRIGFMVSGLAKNGLTNVEERSNMLVVTLPNKEGTVVLEVCSQNEEASEGTNIPTCPEGVCQIPNRITIIDSLARQNSDALNKAHALNSEKISAGSVGHGDERWEFMDRVVETLRSTNDDFGYTCVNKDCEDISTSQISYKCKIESETENTGNPTTSTTSGTTTSTTSGTSALNNPLPEVEVDETIVTIDILKTGGTQWEPSDPETDPQDAWIYPRPGADEDNPEELGGEVGPGGGVSNPESPQNESTSNTPCFGSGSNAPESQSDIVNRIAAATGDLYKTAPDQFTQHVALCLKDVDSKWGRRLNSDETLSKDTVAYQIEGSEVPYSVNIIANSGGSNSTLTWSVPRQDGQCGQTGGQWEKVEGNCIIEIEGHCTQEQKDSENYETVDGQCYPKCKSFKVSNNIGLELALLDIGSGDECEDDENYNTLPINNTLEEKQESQKCCRRSRKGICESGYGLYNGNCHPQCAIAARLAGYNYRYFQYDDGCSGILGVIDKFCTEDCSDLKERGLTNWKDFTFYDPYRFLSSNNIDNISEVLLDSDKNGCCVAGEPDAAPIKAYDADGWHESDHERVGSSSSSNTTPPPATPTPSGGGGGSDECSNDLDCANHAFSECSMSAGSGQADCVNGQCTCT